MSRKKKQALGRDPYDWIGTPDLTPEENSRSPGVPESHQPGVPELTEATGEPSLPKYQQMQRVEALLRPDQVEALDRWVRIIMSSRQAKQERITKNSLLRVAVDLLLCQERDLSDIPSEEALAQRVLGDSGGTGKGPQQRE